MLRSSRGFFVLRMVLESRRGLDILVGCGRVVGYNRWAEEWRAA